MSSKPPYAPKYSHDCDSCVFLGMHSWEDNVYDLYTCKQGRHWPTVIARASSDPRDYQSGIALAKSMEDKTHPLVIALEKAKERGLLSKQDFA